MSWFLFNPIGKKLGVLGVNKLSVIFLVVFWGVVVVVVGSNIFASLVFWTSDLGLPFSQLSSSRGFLWSVGVLGCLVVECWCFGVFRRGFSLGSPKTLNDQEFKF